MIPMLYVVVHEWAVTPERTGIEIVAGVVDEPPTGSLDYYRERAANGIPGTDGRYFIARLTERTARTELSLIGQRVVRMVLLSRRKTSRLADLCVGTQWEEARR